MSRRPGRGDQRGSATLFAVACLALLMVLGAALGVVAAMVHAHRQAQSAADLAALAGAQALARGRDPCSAATAIASANDGTLASCRVDGRDVLVEVRVDGPRWLGQHGDLSGQARAGPG
ncbi:Rv3654c family TadE-like protein [Nocardioides mangrovi]|uniref:Flp pilus-assembly TadE/G-like family protein n=1 Tax=Nocardioides mangrovi TaxID=2874580 RepID=A0ABS7UDN3_9ACTN|nr:Rv3654c family TadE-like protein [Nocardioides mangrovi]MBZ5739106.1 flp pilus-assembly TadE/G-like family protein [Nocardioides mangrovi]